MLWKLALLCSLSFGTEDGPPKGHLVIVGGGTTVEEIRLKALTLAGGPKARVVVVPQASTDPEAGKKLAERWREDGATDIVVLDLSDPKAARDAIGSADLIWMRGGSQNRLMDALTKGGVADAIRARYRAGATVAGTSAGAAVMSTVMISGYSGPRNTPQGRVPRIEKGLGLWPEVVVDQHFSQRQRIERLTKVVADHAELIGVGIDESTAVVVNNGREFEVIGRSNVIIIDSRKAVHTKPKPEEKDSPKPKSGPMSDDDDAPFEPITVKLKAGMRFSLDKGSLPLLETQTARAAPTR
jgi:cyanophycinase